MKRQKTGQLSPEFGGPATSIWKIELKPDGDLTRLEFSDAIFGRVDSKLATQLESDWKLLFAEAPVLATLRAASLTASESRRRSARGGLYPTGRPSRRESH